tara:strand:+ start:5578 stop:5700 length:123 start_codon:yes stop_codon:yes gene_type:complete
MRKVIATIILVMLTGCGTIGGAVSGAAQDVGKVGEYIKNI